MSMSRRQRDHRPAHQPHPPAGKGHDVPGAEMPGAEVVAELREALAETGAPPELLHLLDGPGTPEELLQRVVDSGLLPSPQESLSGLLEFWEPLLAHGTDPLQAELAGIEFVDLVRRSGVDADDLTDTLRGLVAQAEEFGSAAALAMLRSLAVIGPAQVRDEAARAAGRLVAGGLTDPAWVEGLGAPEPSEIFGYADVLGAQQAIAICFRYGADEHAVCVLIDHDLGGGVKDCWLTDQVDDVRGGYAAMAEPGLIEYHQYQPAEARAILTAALDKDPCPEQPDQIEDVRSNLELLRCRVARLTEPLSPAPPARETRRGTVHRLKIGIHGAKPPIWRRLEVPSDRSLDDLHYVIQQAFGWHDCHLWVFETPGGEYGMPDPELGHRSASTVRLEQAAPAAGDRIRYTYDFGDDWVHDILVEEVTAAQSRTAYPRCLAGRRAAPPEDCGGIHGYQYLLEVLADPDHPAHADQLDRLGLDSPDELDPAEFDLFEVNQLLTTQIQIRG